VPLLDYQDTTFLSDAVHEILAARQGDKHFNILTTPLRVTFNRQQELGLFRLLALIRKYPVLLAKLKTLSAENWIDYLRKEYRIIFTKLKRHTDKYCWTIYVYEGPAADLSYFVDILRDLAQRRVDTNRELQKHSTDLRKVAAEQRKLFTSLKLNPSERRLIELARDAVFFKPYRRELQSCSYYQLSFLLSEIGARLGLSLRQVRMMLPSEIGSGLLRGKVNQDEINRRLKILVYGYAGAKYFCLSGDKARDFIKRRIAKEKQQPIPQELRGATAYAGRVRGTVRLINMPSEMGKMRRGDIMVSAATSPNLMAAIRQAGGIITDEGGLTCHAAIVSREFKIPCVVGAKIATKVLHDGDVVDLDAKNAIVKIVKAGNR